MVFGVCQRTLRHLQDAEDATQATFLVLARKAGVVAWHESIAGWLHEVAVRVAKEARSAQARRRLREQQGPILPEKASGEPPVNDDLTEIWITSSAPSDDLRSRWYFVICKGSQETKPRRILAGRSPRSNAGSSAGVSFCALDWDAAA